METISIVKLKKEYNLLFLVIHIDFNSLGGGDPALKHIKKIFVIVSGFRKEQIWSKDSEEKTLDSNSKGA